MSAGIASLDVLGADVEVRDGAEDVRRRRERQQDALGPEPREEIAGVDARPRSRRAGRSSSRSAPCRPGAPRRRAPRRAGGRSRDRRRAARRCGRARRSRRRRRCPAWRIAPPNMCLKRRALPARSLEVAISAPSGQPSPFERHSVTVSASRPHSEGDRPAATAAFMSRAPSRWTASPCARASATTARYSSSGQTRPPAPLCVFSIVSTRVGAAWRSPGGLIAARTSSGGNRPAALERGFITSPE